MPEPIPPPSPVPDPPPPGRGQGPAPPRPTLAHRLLPWVELLYKLLAAAGLALALWRALG